MRDLGGCELVSFARVYRRTAARHTMRFDGVWMAGVVRPVRAVTRPGAAQQVRRRVRCSQQRASGSDIAHDDSA